MSTRHLAIDLREDAIHWVRARRGRRGLTPVQHGRIELRPGSDDAEQCLFRLSRSAIARGARIEVALRGPALALQREELPKLGRRETARVAARRAPELEAGIEGPSCFAFTRSESGEGPLWMAAAPAELARDAVLRWRRRGFELHRLSSRHLALGNLAHPLGLPEGRLVALFDLDADRGTCVVVDREGWMFSREVPLRFMGDRLLRAGIDAPPEERVTPAPPDGDGSGLFLVGEEEAEKPDETLELRPDPLEAMADQAERLATELRRTFQYVAGQLGIGDVSHVYLVGDAPALHALSDTLSLALDLPVSTLGEALAETPCAEFAGAAGVALGLALAPSRSGGNLLPGEVRSRQTAASARRNLRRALMAAVVGVAVWGGVLALLAHAAASGIEVLEQRRHADAPRRELVEHVSEARRRSAALAGALARIDASQPPWTPLLDGLARSLPPRAFIERLEVRKLDGEWTIEMAVEASGDTVAEAAHAVSRFARDSSESPLLTVDDTIREGLPLDGDPQPEARVRFRIHGRVAPLREAGPPPPTEVERG
ncbi:MAG: hypothetical protein ACQGVC_08965 [Myxococcota bacterium]